MAGQLDVTTVLEISHAVSSEIVLDRLVERVLALAVKHSGAARGLLFTPTQQGLRIEAEALAEDTDSSVEVRQARVDPSAMAVSILDYVVQTRRIFNLEDPTESSAFASDPYLSERCPRSILCVPLERHGDLVSVLYLEHHETVHVFTPDRVALLSVLASQAAISLENARLYNDRKRNEIFLGEGQKLSRTGSFGWPIGGGPIVWSEEARRIYGFAPGTDQTAEDVLRLIDPEYRPFALAQVAQVSKTGQDWINEFGLTTADGTRKVVRVVGHAVDGAFGGLEYIGSVMDITAAKRAEEELTRAHLYLSRAQSLSHVGSFGWNIDTGEIVWSEEAFAIYGYDTEVVPTPEHVLVRVHPDDQPRIIAQVQEVMLQKADWISEFRLQMPDGEIKFARVTASAVRNRKGDNEYIGAIMDVTGRRRAEQAEALALANDRLERALRGSNVGIFDFSVGLQDIEHASMYSVNLWESLGYDAGGAESALHLERWHPADRERLFAAARAVLRGELRELDVETRLYASDGTLRWRLNRGVAEHDTSGAPIRLIGTSVDITDRKRLEDAWRIAKDDAEAASRAKDQFLANVSHEIRTPMNAVLGMTELVLESDVTSEQRQWLRTVKRSADNLVEIIDDLLDFSKIQAGMLELDVTDFGLRMELGEMLSGLAIRAERKGLRLEHRVQEQVPDALVGDVGRLRQILLNLVGNAIKFTSAGEVTVSVVLGEPSKDAIELSFIVQDTGIGIPLETQAVIFQAFVQQDTSTTRIYGGTGLGLTIAARLAALMGGGITVHSEPGKGSTFTFNALFRHEQPRAPSMAEPRALEPSSAKSLRVLVAEDNELNSQLLRELLLRRGHRPTGAKDGVDALQLLDAGTFDLMILDLHMPRLDGFQVIAHLRDRERAAGRRLPVIALTARSRHEDRERCLAAGMDDYLAKPIQAGLLWAAIDHVTERRGEATLIDPAAIVAACDADFRVFERLRSELFRCMPAELRTAEACLLGRDLPALREAAHRLNGILGCASVVAGGTVAELEGAAERGALEAARRFLTQLNELVPRLVGEVERVTMADFERFVGQAR